MARTITGIDEFDVLFQQMETMLKQSDEGKRDLGLIHEDFRDIHERMRGIMRRLLDERASYPAANSEAAGQWEPVHKDIADSTERMRVPGGWLYRTSIYGSSETETLSVSLVFVPSSRWADR